MATAFNERAPAEPGPHFGSGLTIDTASARYGTGQARALDPLRQRHE